MNERIAKVLSNMDRAGLDQILVSAPASIKYLTGLQVGPGERLCALLIRSNGQVTLHANRLFALEKGQDFDLVEHDDTDDCIAVMQRDIKPGRLGIDKVWPSGFAVRLMDQRPDVRLALGSAPVDEARMCKTPDEIEKMRLSSLANDRATQKALSAMLLGETEKQAADRYSACAVAEGASGNSFAPLICFGPGAAEPHHDTSADVRLKNGDAVIMDVGLLLDGYCSDMTRTCFMGAMTDEQKKVYDIVRAANEAGRAAAKPGIPLSEIDRAARDVITKAGYGEYFLHRTGHGIGLEVHEPPDVSATSSQIALPGMVFSVEPGIYLKGKFGVRIEDLVAITQDGAVTLNELHSEPMVIQ